PAATAPVNRGPRAERLRVNRRRSTSRSCRRPAGPSPSPRTAAAAVVAGATRPDIHDATAASVARRGPPGSGRPARWCSSATSFTSVATTSAVTAASSKGTSSRPATDTCWAVTSPPVVAAIPPETRPAARTTERASSSPVSPPWWADSVSASRTGSRGATSRTVSASHRPLATAPRPARRAEAARAVICARRRSSAPASPPGSGSPSGPAPDRAARSRKVGTGRRGIHPSVARPPGPGRPGRGTAASRAGDAVAPARDAGPSAVVVEALARLPPQVAGRHHAAQQRDRRVVRVAELLVERVEDGDRRVEAHEVEQGQRPHREVAAALHGRVDVVAAGGAVLEHPHRVVEVGEEEGVDDEPGPVLDDDRVLAAGLGEGDGLGHRLLA